MFLRKWTIWSNQYIEDSQVQISTHPLKCQLLLDHPIGLKNGSGGRGGNFLWPRFFRKSEFEIFRVQTLVIGENRLF